MTANDTATRRVTTGIVLAVGLFAGSDSYSHIYTLARDHGQAIASAALLPLAGDGLIAAASSAMLVASRQGRDVPVLARVMLLAGIGATIAANVGYGLHAGITGALLSVWPVAAYVGCMELLTWMRRNTGMHPQPGIASGDAAADAPDELARRRHSRAPGLLAAAEEAFPAAGAGTSRRFGRSSANSTSARARPSGSRLISRPSRERRLGRNDHDGKKRQRRPVSRRQPGRGPLSPHPAGGTRRPVEVAVAARDHRAAVRAGRVAGVCHGQVRRRAAGRAPRPARHGIPEPVLPAVLPGLQRDPPARADGARAQHAGTARGTPAPAVRRTAAPAVRRGRSR